MWKSYVFILSFNKICNNNLILVLGYFPCTTEGNFPDLTMFTQGKYIECKLVNGGKIVS